MTQCTSLVVLLGLCSGPSGEVAPVPRQTVRTLEAWVRAAGGPRKARAVTFRVPSGWTGDRERDRRSVVLSGPEGEGVIQVALLLHPEELQSYLGELSRQHRGSVPSPPEPMELPQIRIELGDRATRYTITGRQAGEMVLIERRGALVLFATIVAPTFWAEVSAWLPSVYESVRVRDG